MVLYGGGISTKYIRRKKANKIAKKDKIMYIVFIYLNKPIIGIN